VVCILRRCREDLEARRSPPLWRGTAEQDGQPSLTVEDQVEAESDAGDLLVDADGTAT